MKRPQRPQIEWQPVALDQLLAADHRARVVWRSVDSLDLSPLYLKIQAVEGQAGRDAVDPKILMALWMFATIEGSAVPGSSTGCASGILPTGGSVAASG